MKLNNILAKLSLKFQDIYEEQEYQNLKLPLLKNFFNYLFFAFTGILIAYTVRYFLKHIFPQNYIIIGLILVACVLFAVTKKIGKCPDYFLLGYLLLIIALFTTVFQRLLIGEASREAFYIGYAFAMVHRLVGYGVLKFNSMVILYIASISLKFPMIPNSDAVLNCIVVILDLLTVFLSRKSEQTDRQLFDASFKAKKDVLKFKHLLTQYLPNQMAIFANDYSAPLYMNNAFKRSFKCQNISQVNGALSRFIIEKETIQKHKGIFKNIGFSLEDNQNDLTLSHFMTLLSQDIDILRDLGMISIPILETDEIQELVELKQDKPLVSEERDLLGARPNKRRANKSNTRSTGINIRQENARNDESIGSSDKGSSRTTFTDQGYEEGTRRLFKVKLFPLFWDDAEAIAMVMDDITQQKIIMELKVADKNKDLVLATVSHELRTPLNGILGLIDMARKGVQDVSALAYLDACKNSGVLMLNLINSILDLQQVKDNKLKLIHTKFSVRELLNEIHTFFDHFRQVKRLYFKLEISPSVPETIVTDRNRLSQIIVNLLGNAFKFTFSGGVSVKVDTCRSSPSKIKFSVCDTGIGIKKEDQERLFKMYGKLEQKNAKINTQGIGLGLTISNTLVNLLNPSSPGNNSITFKSEVDKGTSFSFTVESQGEHETENITGADISSLFLNENRHSSIHEKINVYSLTKTEKQGTKFDPKVEHEIISTEKKKITMKSVEAAAEEETLKFPVGHGGGDYSGNTLENKARKEAQWCLVVDDNPFNLMVASHIMEERGYQVKNAMNGQEAVDKAKEHSCKENMKLNLILMDCQMPVMDGYEATKILKDMMKSGEISGCPIIALTANNRNEDHENLCKQVGMDGHIAKPLQISELEAVLKKTQKNFSSCPK